MSRRLSSGISRAAFGAFFAFACAGAAFAMTEDASSISPVSAAADHAPAVAEDAPQTNPITAPANVLRTLDGKPWSVPSVAPAPMESPLHPETPAAAIVQALDAAVIVQSAAEQAQPIAVIVPTPQEAPTVAPVVDKPALPVLATLEFNPAAVPHSENVRAAPAERSVEAKPAARTAKNRTRSAALAASARSAASVDVTLGRHSENDALLYQVQALLAPSRSAFPVKQATKTAATDSPASPEPDASKVQVVALNAAPVASAPQPASIVEAAQAPVETLAPNAPVETASVAAAAEPSAPVVAASQPAADPAPSASPASSAAADPTVAVAAAPAAAAPTPAVATEAPVAVVAASAPATPAVVPAPLPTPPATVETQVAVVTTTPTKGSLSGAPSPAPAADPDTPAPLLQQAAYTGIDPRVDWRDVISEKDKTRLKNLLATRAAAIKQAEAAIDSGDKDAVAAAPATSNVLYAKPMTSQESDLVGAYRCRITRLGGPYPQLSAYRFTTCEVSQWPDGSLVIEKTSGTSRFIGRLWREADSSFVYLGTVMPDEGTPWAYDEKPEENQVGRLYRIGASRLRLELPKPNTGSALDIVEFVRLK